LYLFWLKIFAVSFGMGVVSGIVMSFQFGTNWAVLSERAGNILGRCSRTKCSPRSSSRRPSSA
jgi:cytochrome bd-type quinol oxidase subunit 1